jgi:hypothetical protein
LISNRLSQYLTPRFSGGGSAWQDNLVLLNQAGPRECGPPTTRDREWLRQLIAVGRAAQRVLQSEESTLARCSNMLRNTYDAPTNITFRLAICCLEKHGHT